MKIDVKPVDIEEVIVIHSKDMHTLEDHNYWVGRGCACPYCTQGSEPVPKDLLLRELDKR